MGGASSKTDAFVGSNSNGGDQSSSSTVTAQAPCSCFNTFFCPPKNPNNNSSSKNNNSSSQQQHHKTKSFGTPLPDTPENVRRIRAGENNNSNNNGYYYEKEDGDNDHEEKKIGGSGGGGSFGRTNKLIAEVRSSRYGGLEKEESGMFSYENKGGGRGGAMIGGKIVEEKSADIHDGKVSC
jgi:hypothetical protein